MEGILPAWGRILGGYRPNLSIEITRECPLRCPGCYAYTAGHRARPSTDGAPLPRLQRLTAGHRLLSVYLAPAPIAFFASARRAFSSVTSL
jgi:hypothetical protein